MSDAVLYVHWNKDSGAIQRRGRRRYNNQLKQSIKWVFFIFIYFLLHGEQEETVHQLLMMVDAGGTETCVHPHESHLRCVMDKDKVRIYLLARRNLLWDILRLPSNRRAALGLYVILTL